MNQLGIRIKKIRLAKGLTQEKVATKLFLSLKAYQNIEHGITKIDLERIKQLADIFEISMDELINSTEFKIRFEASKHREKLADGKDLNVPMNSEIYNLLLKEKDNEITFLKELLNKFIENAR